jgi:16S rRNA (uracil1498-N3)-methyltransferase
MPPRQDFTSQRLFVRAPLGRGARIDLDHGQVNYLVNVLRLADGARLLVFNGREGEWHASLATEGRRRHVLLIGEPARPQPAPLDLHYLFAPLKQARLDYMVEKAVEMGAGRLRPVLTQHTQVHKLNLERMEANTIEAAEQCGILSIPRIDEPSRLDTIIDGWADGEPGRRLVFCDEGEEGGDPLAILAALPPSPLAVLIGPEGGFSVAERHLLRAQPFVTAIPLGPRILRADTAAVAALAIVQASLGDWKSAADDGKEAAPAPIVGDAAGG